MGSVAKRTSENEVAARRWSMVVPSLDDCIQKSCKSAKGQEWNQIRRAMRGGEGGGRVKRVTEREGKGANSSKSGEIETIRN
jgi:hypothetical protein